MSSLPYFPFDDDVFKMIMKAQALLDHSLVEVDEDCYQDEMALKHALLSSDCDDYFRALDGTEAQQWEVLALLLPNMVARYPQHFELIVEGEHWWWRNQLLQTETHFVLGKTDSLPLPPLDWLGRQVHEDLLVMSGTADDGMRLIAGHLCFPNAWCIEEKIGKSYLGIHQPVPLFKEHLARPSGLLLERLKVGRPVWRINWAIKATPRLNLTPRYFAEEVEAYQHFTVENIGMRCFLRIERQTLSRLPQTSAVLFTVRTYQAPLAAVLTNVEHARRISGVIATMPKDMLIYKNIEPYIETLLTYIQQCALS
jgi:hypothetical protein